jgi:pectate lyase
MRVQLGALILVVWGASAAVAAEDAADRVRFDAVRRFADNLLDKGRDHYGLQPTPLLVDGVDVDTGEGVTWTCKKQTWTVCDPANHQQLYRVLVGLTNVTGDKHYRAAAEAEWRYLLAHYADQNGLLKWGGHRLIEFKCNYPYYAFLWETDPAATERFVKALWNAHVLDYLNASVNTTEPLALLSLEAAIRGQPQLVPAYCAGRGYIHGPHDGMGRTYDSAGIYSKKRGE